MQRQSTPAPRAAHTPKTYERDRPAPRLLNPCDDPQWRHRLDEARSRVIAAAAGDRGAFGDRLNELDDLIVEALCEAERRVWLQVGRALTALGRRRLWAALYALGPGYDWADSGGRYPSGDEREFLELNEATALPPRPDGWPWPWLD